MRRKYSVSRTLAVSLLLQGVVLGLYGENSGQFDLNVAVTYNLAGPTTIPHKSSPTDGLQNSESTLQQKDAATATCTEFTNDASGCAGFLSASSASTSDLIDTTGAFVGSRPSIYPSIAPWSSATRSGVIGKPDEPSHGELPPANPMASANVFRTNTTSHPTSSMWPSIVTAHPPTGNYTGLWTPPNPSDTRKSSAAHALEWNNYMTLGTLICGILYLT